MITFLKKIQLLRFFDLQNASSRVFTWFLAAFLCFGISQSVFSEDDSKKIKMVELCEKLVSQCKNEDIEGAQATLAEAELLKTSPEVICYMKGMIAETQKNVNEAQMQFTKAVEIKLDYSSAHLKLASMFRRQGDLETAALHFDKAFHGHASSEEKVKAKLGTLLILEQQQMLSKETLKHFKELQHAVPHSKYPYKIYLLEARVAFEAAEYTTAQKAASNAATAADAKNLDEVYYLHVAASHALKDYESMGKYIDQIKSSACRDKLKSMDYEHYYNLGFAYYHAYELEKSQHCIDIALKIKPTYLNAVQYQNLLEKKAADKSRDISHANHKLIEAKHAQHSSSYYADLARLYLHEKKYTKAIHCADSCLRLDAQNGEVVFLKAIAQYKHHHAQDAVKTLNQLLNSPYTREEENRDKVLFTQALFYKSLHQSDKARQNLETIVSSIYQTAAKHEETLLK
ncbi:MAG: hypothetical protein EAZ57_03040 [Cytophagales bacterium]|nr:MAG: hypothetical protein EAZ67_03505 [Cytophagales bacterium]TAF61734.1 MAG: hypothetical protein EAZ57_03040 [Cytophagales bacterium]